MKKEEIIEKIKKENKNGDEKYLLDRQSSYAIGYSVATALCLVLSVIESYVFNRSDTVLWLVYAATCFSVSLSEIIKSKKKWLLAPTVVTGIAVVVLTVLYCLGK